MKAFIVGAICGLVLAGGAVMAKDALYSLKPVTSTEDTAACAKAGGLGALVAPLTESGDLAAPWEAHCLVPAK